MLKATMPASLPSKRLMDVSVEIFKIKRRWMDLIRANSRMPFAMQRPKDPNTGERGALAVDLEGLVYTIGVVGVNEMVQHHTGRQPHESKEAFRLAIRAMTEMELYARGTLEKEQHDARPRPVLPQKRRPAVRRRGPARPRYHDYAVKVIKGDLEGGLEMLGKSRDLPLYYTNGTHVAPVKCPPRKTYGDRARVFPDRGWRQHFPYLARGGPPGPPWPHGHGHELCRNSQIGYFAFTRDITVSLRQFHEMRTKRNPVSGYAPSDFPVKV